MIVFHGKNSRTPERGVALVVALLMLLLISAALMGMVMMSNTETNISSNFRDEEFRIGSPAAFVFSSKLTSKMSPLISSSSQIPMTNFHSSGWF